MTPEQFGHLYDLFRTSLVGTNFNVKEMINVAKTPAKPVFDAMPATIEGELPKLSAPVECPLLVDLANTPGLDDIHTVALQNRMKRDEEAT